MDQHIETEYNKGGRPKKKDKFETEREAILNKLNSILGINDANNMFHVYDIDNSIEKQNQINALEDEIKKVFKVGNWTVFAKELKTRKYLSLIRSLYKDMGYTFISTIKSIKRDGKTVRSKTYILNKEDVK